MGPGGTAPAPGALSALDLAEHLGHREVAERAHARILGPARGRQRGRKVSDPPTRACARSTG
jgi:hypothetical protein